jgi:hypothetical protein
LKLLDASSKVGAIREHGDSRSTGRLVLLGDLDGVGPGSNRATGGRSAFDLREHLETWSEKSGREASNASSAGQAGWVGKKFLDFSFFLQPNSIEKTHW